MTDGRRAVPADEIGLDLAVELVNTFWVLADPPDRLTDVAVYQGILRDVGQDDLARELTADDLGELLRFRAAIGAIFAAGRPEEAVAVFNRLLRDTTAALQLTIADGLAQWTL